MTYYYNRNRPPDGTCYHVDAINEDGEVYVLKADAGEYTELGFSASPVPTTGE